MCLFLTALLRDDRISLDEYGIEIREFCVQFLWVVEAADVLCPEGIADYRCIDSFLIETSGKDDRVL
jgi:hypothetical protein